MRADSRLLLLVGLLALWPARSRAACPNRAYWPTVEWRSRADQVATSKAAEIQVFEASVFPPRVAGAPDPGFVTEGVIVVQGGEILYERYGNGYDQRKRRNHVTLARSVFNGLTGVAVAQGALALDDSVCAHLRGVREDNCGITVGHLLSNSSGLRWQEYEHPASAALDANQRWSLVNMYLGEGRADAARFVLNHERRDDPGTSWQYSNGDSTALGGVLAAALSPGHGERWAFTLLLDRIGAGDSVLTHDRQGTPIWWISTLRDVARLAYLYLNDGCWDGERLLPEGWVAATFRVPEAFLRKRVYESPITRTVPGLLWMLNAPVPELGLSKVIPGMPDDMVYSHLGWNQILVILPSRDLIIAYWIDWHDTTNEGLQLAELASTLAE